MSKTTSRPATNSVAWHRGRIWEWIAIGWVVGYVLWFYSQPLQHSIPAISRWEIWLRLPDLLLANVFGEAGELPGRWINLRQRLDLITVTAAIWLGAWAAGSLLLRGLRLTAILPPLDGHVFACGLGLSALSLLTLACGLLGHLSPWLLGGVCIGALAIEVGLQIRSRFTEHAADDDVSTHVRGTAVVASAIEAPNYATRRSCTKKGTGPFMMCGSVTQDTMGRGPVPFFVQSFGIVVMLMFLTAMLLGALLPPIDFDVKTYHLSGPKEFFLKGKIAFLPHNVYTSFPFLTEMLSLLAMVLRQDWFRGALAGQAVLMGFAPLTAVALYCAGRRWFSRPTAWLTAVFYLTTPWTYRLAVIAYVEGALSCYLFLSLYAILIVIGRTGQPTEHDERNKWALILLSGLLAGSAMACKYPGLVSVVAPIGACAVYWAARKQSLVRATNPRWSGSAIGRVTCVALAFSIGVAFTIGPWLAKNVLETGNPVYPLAYRVFGGRDWNEASHSKWQVAHSPSNYDAREFLQHSIDVAVRSNWLSSVLFCFGPLAFLVLRGKRRATPLLLPTAQQLVVWLWLYVIYLFVTWWLLTHRLDRFWVPMLPIVAWLAAIGATWSTSAIWIIVRNLVVGTAVLFNLAFITTSLCGLNSYLSDLNETRERCENTAEDVQYINRLFAEGKLQSDSVVLLVGQAQNFDARVPVIYNTLFDESIFCQWFAMSSPSAAKPEYTLRPVAEIRKTLASHGVTHIVVNWESLLANRATYGSCDFVSPSRLRQLREIGLLGDPTQLLQGLRAPELLSDRARQELDTWGAELKDQENGLPVYIAWQVFPVMMEK